MKLKNLRNEIAILCICLMLIVTFVYAIQLKSENEELRKKKCLSDMLINLVNSTGMRLQNITFDGSIAFPGKIGIHYADYNVTMWNGVYVLILDKGKVVSVYEIEI